MKIRSLNNLFELYRKPKIEGTQLIIPIVEEKETKYLFTITKEKYWKKSNDRLLIQFTGVGGAIEKEETPSIAIRREAMEETGCDVYLYHAKKTLFIDLFGRITFKELKVKPAPVAIYERDFPGKPGRPDAHGKWRLKSHIFVGSLLGNPKPSREIPALIFLSERQINLTISELKTVKEILDDGARIIEVRHIPRDAFISPTRAPEILSKALNGRISKLLEYVEDMNMPHGK